MEYEDDGSVSFIGVNSNANLALEFEGIDLFDTEAEAAFFLLAIRDGTGDHAFSSFEYILPAQIVTFYEADFQYDHRQGGMRRVWGQIGCGDQRYLNAILKIQDGVLNPNPPEKA